MAIAGMGPLIPRRRLGAAFRELREARSETLQQTARALMFSPSKLSRIENGLAGEPHPRDVRDLISHFGLDGEDHGARLEELAEAGRALGWWQVPPFRTPPDLDTFISYESAASSIEIYSPTVVPGLVQTRDYARATMRAILPDLDPDETDHLVDIRLERRRHLEDNPDPPLQRYTIPETVLHRVIGSPTVLHEQLDALVEAFDNNAQLDLHVIPFSAGLYEAAELSTITIFRFPDVQDPPVVVIERSRFIEFMHRPDTIDKYSGILGRLPNHWLDRTQSREFIERVRRSKYQEHG